MGVRGSCEAAVHSLRQYVLDNSDIDNPNIVLKIDITNAFNSVHCQAILQEVRLRCPKIYHLVHQSYIFHSPLYVENTVIPSPAGVQQGDLLGPLIFALALDPIIRSIESPLNLWFVDDGSIAGPGSAITKDLQQIIVKLAEIGLQLNPKKCELIPMSPASNSSTAALQLQSILPGIKTTEKAELTYLNSPIPHEAIPNAIKESAKALNTICDRVQYLDSHTGLFILTHYTSAPRLNYLMRSSPTYHCPEALSGLDAKVRETAASVCKVKMENKSWAQASLPTRMGGLGLCCLSSLALPCFHSSLHKSLDLVNQILPESLEEQPTILDEAVRRLKGKYPAIEVPSGEGVSQQRAWDDAISKIEFDNLLSSANQIESARLLAAASPHSGAWLHALPIDELGLKLEDDAIRIAVSLRI